MKTTLMTVFALAVGCMLTTVAWSLEPVGMGATDIVIIAKGPAGGYGPGDGTGTGDGTGGYGPGDCEAHSPGLYPMLLSKGGGYGPGDGTGTGDGTGGFGPGDCDASDA